MEKKQKTLVVVSCIVAVAVMLSLFFGIPAMAAAGAIIATEMELGLVINETIVVEFSVVAASLIVLLIFWLIFRRRKFKGVINFKKNKKDVYIGYCITIVVDIICLIVAGLLLDGGLKALVMPSLATFALSLYAGVFEETVFRAVPISIIMKNKPDSLRIYLAVLITSLCFGLVHISNLAMGASVQITIVQVIGCFITGIFLAAIYLRTGSILMPMFFHFFHDFINVMLPAQSTGVMLQTSIKATDIIIEVVLGITELAVALFLLRKCNHEEIKNRWAYVWGEEAA